MTKIKNKYQVGDGVFIRGTIHKILNFGGYVVVTDTVPDMLTISEQDLTPLPQKKRERIEKLDTNKYDVHQIWNAILATEDTVNKIIDRLNEEEE